MIRYIDASMMLLAVAFFFALTAWQGRRDKNAETAPASRQGTTPPRQGASAIGSTDGTAVAVSAIRSGGPQREGKHVLSLESEPDQPKGTA